MVIRPRRRGIGSTHLAGWLFADLMIVLFLAALMSLPPSAVPAARPEPSASAAAPTPSSSASPSAAAPVLELDAVDLSITVPYQALLAARGQPGPADDAVQSAFHQALTARGLNGRVAGLMLSFGGGSADRIGQATEVARLTNLVLTRRELGFAHARVLSYWDGNAPMGTVTMKLYFFSQ